jgi:hypothetical protein
MEWPKSTSDPASEQCDSERRQAKERDREQELAIDIYPP